MWIVKVALNQPYTFIVLALLVLILSPVMISRTPTEIFPNINLPVIAVAWQYTGLNPEELEGRLCFRREFLQRLASQEAELDTLYSKFPAGSVGLALLLLRLADGLGLVGEGIHLFTPAGTSSEPTSALLLGLVLGASAILLILGRRTSLARSAAAIATAGTALYFSHHLNQSGSEMDAWLFLFALVFFLSSSLALLGPGGYSLDARLSGWRMIRLSSRQSRGKNAD